MTFKDDSPGTPHEYLNMGCDITPCIDKRPILADWQNKKTKEEDWQENICYPLVHHLEDEAILVVTIFILAKQNLKNL